MLKNVFTKTIYNRRFVLLGFSVGTFLLTIFVISLFHSLSGGQFGQAIENLPKSLEGLIGQSDSYTNLNGYINQQIFVRTLPILGTIFGILIFTGNLAGEEQEGTLQVLLTQPVSRAKVLVQKLFASAVIVFALCTVISLACFVGALIVNEPFHALGILAVAFNLWLIVITFGSFAYMLGAATGKRGLAGGVAGIIAFTSYLITSLSVGVQSLQSLDKISPFHYYGSASQNVILRGLELPHVLVLVSLTLVFSIVALITFQKRDIYQR